MSDALATLCWCCGSELVARYDAALRVLICVACAADSTIAQPAPVCDERVRCLNCKRLLALFVTRPYRFTCPRCKALTAVSA